MSKYIDAEKLKRSIENIGLIPQKQADYNDGREDFKMMVLDLIDSLQQEPRFPQYNNIVDKVFGAGNLESWEYREAEMLVTLAKEELLKSLQQEKANLPSGEDVMTMCNQILIDWVKEGKTQEEKEQREQAHIRFFELYDDYLIQEQHQIADTSKMEAEVDLEKEMDEYYGMYRDNNGKTYDYDNNEPCFDWKEDELSEHELRIARHFYELGLNSRK